MRKQFVQSTDGLGGQAFQDILQIAIGVLSVELGGLDETHDVGRSLTGTLGSGKEPVVSAQCYRPDPVFDVDIVDRQIALLELAGESRPASKAIVDRLSCGGAIRHLAALSSEPLVQGFRERLLDISTVLPIQVHAQALQIRKQRAPVDAQAIE